MGASIAPLWQGQFGLGFVWYQVPNLQETSWDFSSRRILIQIFHATEEQRKTPWMATANDKNFSGPGPKVIGTYYRPTFRV